MLKGNTETVRSGVFSASLQALQAAWAGETHVNWNNPVYQSVSDIIEWQAKKMADVVLVKPIGGQNGDMVPYVKGKVTGKEIKAMLDVGKECFSRLYPNESMNKVRSRKYRIFCNNFKFSIKTLVTRWNHESEAYYPNGRPRKSAAS